MKMRQRLVTEERVDGVVPTIAFKRLVQPLLGKMLQPAQGSPDETLVLYLKAGHVGWGRLDLPEELPEMWATETDIYTLHPKVGDLLICEGGEVGRATVIGKPLPPTAIVQNSLHLVRQSQSADVRYLRYALEHAALSGWLDILCNKATIAHLTNDKLRDLRVPFHIGSKQTRIANFLDEQTARINALIAEKERLVEVLHELMVSRLAFEMGGGANASIKTHYEWYPAIPLAWKVIPFKYAVRFVEGPGILAQDFRDEGVPLLRVSSLRGALATLDGCNYLDPVKVAKVWSHFRVKRGDLLISASATMGTVSLVTEDAEGAVPYTGIIILRPDESIAIRDFVRSFVISDQFMRQIDSMKAGATIQHFGPTHLNRVVMAVPESVAEQVVVAARLERWREAYEKSVASITAHVLSLREYRSSMISAAVTGQLDIDSFEKGVA